MPLSVQPLQGQGNISGVATMPNPAPLSVAPTSAPAPISVAPPQTQQPISIQQPQQQALSYVGTSTNPTAQVAPLSGPVQNKMTNLLTQAKAQYPGQEAQILQQFIAENKSQYPAQMAKIQSFIGSPGSSRTQRNNNPTAMTTDVAQSLGLQPGVDYTQGDPFKDSQGQTLYTADLTGSDPISATVAAFNKAAANGTPIFTTANGTPRWKYINMTNAQWQALTPAQQTQTVQHMNQMENGAGGSNTNATGFSPAEVLTSLIQDNQPQAIPPSPGQAPAAWDSGGILTGSTGLVHNISNDFQNIQQSENQNVANQQAGKEGPVAGLLQELGAGAQGINSVIGEGLKSVFRSVAPQPVQQGVAAIGNNSTVQKVLGTASGFLSKESAQHPVGMANASAITNIALALAPFLPGGEEANAVEKTQGAYEDALGATKSGVQTGSKIAARSGESPAEFLANAGIPPETDVVNGRRIFTTGPDSQTYATIQQRTSALTNLRDDALSTIKSPSSVEDLRQTALSQAKTQFVGKEYQQVVDHINSEFDAFKTQPGVSEDTIPSVNNIKKYFQGNAGYDATRPSTITEANRMVANIAKTQVETDAEAAGVPGIKELNKTIQQHLDFLDDGNKKGILSKLNGQVIKGGKIGTYTKEIIGAGVGGAVGHFLGGGLLGEALGGLGGVKAGDLVSSFMQSLAAGGSGTAGILGKIATENPQVVQQFLDYLGRSGESVAPIVKPALSIGSLPKTLLSGSAGLIQNLSPKN